MKKLTYVWVVAVMVLVAFRPSAMGWSQPHQIITKAALDVLPAWQKAMLGEELFQLGDDYCLIPDHVFTDREKARYAMVEGQPKEVYRLNLHLPAQQAENLETTRYFLGRAVEAARAGNIQDAARYMGTVCHQIEDYGSPSHTMPGDNMFTLLQQFLPPPDAMKGTLLHGPVESGEFSISLTGYKPALLGATVEEAAWKLMHRIHECILNARSTTIPIIEGLYQGNAARVEEFQKKAAQKDAEVVADAVYTMLCLGRYSAGELEASPEGQGLNRHPVGTLFPVEAVGLYYPQSQFFSSPYWGCPRSGVVLVEGKRPQSLQLTVEVSGVPESRTFDNGISAGMGRSLTFLLPAGVYSRFTVFGGLHREMGVQGRVEFKLSGDGKVLCVGTVSGSEAARAFDCSVEGVAHLQLTLSGQGGDPKSAYAIWGDPVLWKR